MGTQEVGLYIMSQLSQKNNYRYNKPKENFWDGQGYHFNSKVQYTAALNLLSHYEFRGNEVVLDVGCGDGKLSTYIASKVKQGYVVGIDQSKSMIDFAKTNYKNSDHPNLEFTCKDANQFEEVDKFDIVFSSFCIQWIINIESFFARVMIGLKPGGTLLAVIPSGIPVELDKSFTESIQNPRWLSYFKGFEKNWKLRDDKAFMDTLLKLGFKISFCREAFQVHHFHDALKLKEYINFSFPYPSYIPPNFREEYVNEIVEDYMSRVSLDLHHQIPFKFPVVEIKSEKPTLQ